MDGIPFILLDFKLSLGEIGCLLQLIMLVELTGSITYAGTRKKILSSIWQHFQHAELLFQIVQH